MFNIDKCYKNGPAETGGSSSQAKARCYCGFFGTSEVALDPKRHLQCARNPSMTEEPKLDRARRRRIRNAERKLRDAQMRLARTERSVLYWSRALADLRHEQTRAIQHTLWPEEDPQEGN